jgi:hypothetical protein
MIILAGLDLATEPCPTDMALIGGFHTPLERRMLSLMLKAQYPLVICPARTLTPLRVPPEWRDGLAQGHLLLLSPFASAYRRPTATLARQRNELVAAFATALLVLHATPDGQTAALATRALQWGKPVHTIHDQANAHLLALGAHPYHPPIKTMLTSNERNSTLP